MTANKIRMLNGVDDTGGQQRLTECDMIRFNIGGTQFKTFRSTLEKQAVCRLNDLDFLEKHFCPDLGEYFFDRDPDMFKCLLNYLRSGELHLPSHTCTPVIKQDMEFWGLKANAIEKCCFLAFNEWDATQKALGQLERRRSDILSDGHVISTKPSSGWKKLRRAGWAFLNDSSSSLAAKIAGWVSFLFVIISISSFMADTTAPFQYYIATHNGSTASSGINNLMVDSTTTGSDILSDSSRNTSHITDNFINKRVQHPILEIIDWICLAFFTTEYIIRIVFAPKRLKHVTTMTSIIDILALLPDYIEFIMYEVKPELKDGPDTVGVLTILRVIRVLRIFRLMRHSAGLWILVFTLRASFSELLLLFWFMSLGILLFASLIYYTEKREDFESIPAGFWWALITMTTVGYGDMYPKTVLGKLVGSLCAMSGVLMIGFTVPALVNNFMLYYRHIQYATRVQSDDDLDDEPETGHTVVELAHAPSRNICNPSEKSWEKGKQKKNKVEDVKAFDRLLHGKQHSFDKC